jgi:hypothetical protein
MIACLPRNLPLIQSESGIELAVSEGKRRRAMTDLSPTCNEGVARSVAAERGCGHLGRLGLHSGHFEGAMVVFLNKQTSSCV